MGKVNVEHADIVSITTRSCDGKARSTRDIKVMLGDKEVGGIISVKLGSQDGDGTLRSDNIVTATIEMTVKLGE